MLQIAQHRRRDAQPVTEPCPALSRRELLRGAAAAAAGALAGCAAPYGSWRFSADEQRLLSAPRGDFAIVVRGGPGASVLRRRARPVATGVDLTRVAQRMERTMRAAQGVGIAGPQVGLPLRVACLMLGYRSAQPRVVFVRNPRIVDRSEETIVGYEGCLSIPGVGGLVRRARWIRVVHAGAGGERLQVEAEGPDAVLWQHELDHLDGVLYTDRVLGPLLPMEEVRRRRRAVEQQQRPGAAFRWDTDAGSGELLA